LTQVEAKLKTNGPLDAITKLLDEFKKTITDEQLAHDNLHARQQAECASEFEFREKEIRDAEGALKAAQETLDGCKAQYVRATSDLEATKAALRENTEFLGLLVENRKRQEYDFETVTTGF
jgi:septal ring factor EnvC (AmiA/AmiB activator)